MDLRKRFYSLVIKILICLMILLMVTLEMRVILAILDASISIEKYLITSLI